MPKTPITKETNCTAKSSIPVRIQKINKMASQTSHGTGRNINHWEMAASHLHKGNCGFTQVLLFLL